MSDNKKQRELILTGISASPGICIGKAYLVDREGVDVIKRYHILKPGLQNEKNRFKKAVKQAKSELNSIISNTPEGLRQHSDILTSHMMLMEDKMLFDRTIETIGKEMVNAEWALKKVVSKVRSMFQDISDPYLKDRAIDVDHVSERIMLHLAGVNSVSIADIDKRVILVAQDLSPAQTSQINLERIKGFVTVRGGVTSHTSIIARTLGIPAVQGVADATTQIHADDIIIVDGSVGSVVINPSEQTLVAYGERQERFESFRASIARISYRPSETIDGFRIRVMGNIEQPEQVVSVMDNGGEGIGLYRTEFQYLSRAGFPDEDELFDKYRGVVEVMPSAPVTIRTLDINGDKAVHNSTMMECNPVLGLRAIRYCLQRPEIFQTQLRAILRATAFGDVRILFPMISTYDELLASKKMLAQAMESLDKSGIEFNRDIAVGVMIEVPSLAIMADMIAPEVDFFSIGTNDLIQYSMAVDRTNKEVAHLYNPLHPAILRMLKFVSDAAKDHNIELFMCGEMAGDPFNLPILMGLGIDELSMNPQAIPMAKNVIRSLSAAETRPFLENVLMQTTAGDVENLVRDAYGDIISKATSPE
ncbi:MAG: phosphoenolpyruvate--protein phosphotransferase [Deltaproteobacteria bacterium]|nr:MAG: phosphoenolpyruvate--protein phosphotransferase [Deltaproteobacteria bacterium]RLC18278.1 MAG: phosphoenolpyruvate--protein phosphotransferase [Deltaproteobacteria bacterium]